MTPGWARTPSSNNPKLIRNPLTHYMKTITYLLTAFSCGFTSQCLAGMAGFMPGPFFLLGFAGAIFTLSRAFKG